MFKSFNVNKLQKTSYPISIFQVKAGGRMRAVKLILFVSALFVAGCEESITTIDDINNETMESGRIAVFSKIQERLFNPSCALSGCHSGSNPTAEMNLSEGSSYNNIVGVNSIFYPQLKRIAPGDTNSSVMLQVLRKKLTPFMPPAGNIQANLIDSLAAWINEGAKNN